MGRAARSDEPSILALDLLAGRFEVAARAAGGEPAPLLRPFPVEVVAADQVAPPSP